MEPPSTISEQPNCFKSLQGITRSIFRNVSRYPANQRIHRHITNNSLLEWNLQKDLNQEWLEDVLVTVVQKQSLPDQPKLPKVSISNSKKCSSHLLICCASAVQRSLAVWRELETSWNKTKTHIARIHCALRTKNVKFILVVKLKIDLSKVRVVKSTKNNDHNF